MASAIDHIFIADFHPLPRSDRRQLFSVLAISDVDYRNDDAFFGWLAERYATNDVGVLDAAIRTLPGKASERGIDAALCEWLVRKTNRRRRMNMGAEDRRKFIEVMAKEVLQGSNREAIQQLRALAANYGWLSVKGLNGTLDTTLSDTASFQSQKKTRDQQDIEDEVGTDDTSVAKGAASTRANREKAHESADHIDVILERLIAAIGLLRANPNEDLAEWANTLAGAIEAHVNASEKAVKEEEALEARRVRLAAMFAALDSATTARLGTPDLTSLPLEAAERLETEFEAFLAAADGFRRAQDAFREAASAGRDKRAIANRALDEAEQAYEAVLARLATEISKTDRYIATALMPGLDTHDESVGGSNASKESSAPELSAADRVSLIDDASGDRLIDEHEDQSPPTVDIAPVIEIEMRAPVADVTHIEAQRTAVTGQTDSVTPSAEELSKSHTSALNARGDNLGQTPFDVDEDAPDRPAADFYKWDNWIEAALRQGRFGLALHLADGRHLAGADLPRSISPTALEGLLRGLGVQGAYSRAWAAYDDLKQPLLALLDDTHGAKDAHDLLLFAGAVRPAMLQSETARELLTSLDGEIAARLNPLRAVLHNVASQRLANIAEIAAPPGDAERQRRADEIRARLQTWFDGAPGRKTNYQQATAVWLELADRDGLIGDAMCLALGEKKGTVAAVAHVVTRLEDDADGIIDDTQLAIAKGIRREAIEGIARKQLRGLIDSATGLLHDWIQVQQDLGPKDDRFRSHREALLVAVDQARENVRPLHDGCDQGTAAAVFDIVMDGLAAQLRGITPLPELAEEQLDWEIALLPDFPLNARRGFRIEASDTDDLATAAAMNIDNRILSIDAAFKHALVIGNVSSATRLISRLTEVRDTSPTEEIEQASGVASKALANRKKLLRQRLDDLQIASTIPDTELDDLERALTGFEQIDLDGFPLDVGDRRTIADFPFANRELDNIERQLERIRAPHRAALELRIHALETLHGARLEDCWAQLERGDLGTLSEEVDQIEHHGLIDSAEAAPLAALTRFADVLGQAGDKPAVAYGNLPKAAREGCKLDAFDFGDLSDLDRERATMLLEAWNSLRRTLANSNKRSDKDEAAKIGIGAAQLLKALGFTGVSVSNSSKDDSWYSISVSTIRLRSRDDCPVPVFGSERLSGADGMAHYAIVIVPPGNVDACISRFDRMPDHALLFIADALDKRQRRDIQRRARRSTRSIAVADSVTIAAMATIKDRRLKQFFELAIPFGNAQPYADTGSETAIENFFGREQELRTLVDPRGACFVYGGRQLGKTALLRQIELRENDNPDRVAIHCHIKPIGESAPSEAVWETIRRELELREVALPKGANVSDQLKAWVQKKAGRYLLIMLDEADAFLASEMKANFPIIEEMKALMESTLRGVKFVFAGLHNVQRFYRAPNSPLLHLGTPINVGPLLGSDRLAARQMAIEPMAALGFDFENKLDAYHMLSLIGFYPSLMQSFGKAVVETMSRELASSTYAGSMPALIRRNVVDAAFNDQLFRRGVAEKFLNTLKLDERYELITYAVWMRMQDDSNANLSTAFGYSAPEIWRLSREWWPAGFADTDSLESFTAILDEMDEMGVLARKGDLYALRSQRIAAMLGGRTEIEHRLLNLIQKAPRRRPDPLRNHRRIGARWSPLTLRQEAALLKRLSDTTGPRVILISAAPASGLGWLPETVETLIGAPGLEWPKARRLLPSSPEKIAEVATFERRDAAPHAPKIIIIEGAWPSAEALNALRRDKSFRQSGRPVRLVWIGEPTGEVLAMPSTPDLLIMSASPLTEESLLHWMNRESLPYSDDEHIQRELRITCGGWLQPLDTTPVAATLRKRSYEALIEAVRANAAKMSLADLGLNAKSAEFAKALFTELEEVSVTTSDLMEWAVATDANEGELKLSLLQTLGIIERSSDSQGQATHAFNPLAARLLV